MTFWLYRNPRFQDKTFSQLFHYFNGEPYTWKMVFVLKPSPVVHFAYVLCSVNHSKLWMIEWPIPAWMSNCIHYGVWAEISYPFPKFNLRYYWACDYLSVLALKFILVSKRGPRKHELTLWPFDQSFIGCLTHWDWDNMADILQTIFSDAFCEGQI